MSQKFISLDDAAVKLGVPKERLNQLREAGDLRAYRDGASWKFRTEEIEKLEESGVPGGEIPSDGGDADDLTLDAGADLDLGDLDAETDIGDGGPPTPELGGIEDDAQDKKSDGDDDIGLGIEPLGDGDDAESILLTGDDELEGGMPRPQSTIIGKSELSLESDLQLAGGSDLGPPAPPAAEKTETPAAPSGAFDDLEELELDLETESSRILDSKEASAARDAASAASGLSGDDLELDLAGSDLTSDGGVEDVLTGQEANSGVDLAGPGSVGGLSGIDAVQLDDDEDDDLVLGGSDEMGGLASGDSGINLAPSDSGFALDEVPLDLGGSAIGSALDLASLSAAGSMASGLGSNASGIAEDFQLTPADSGEEEEDSSQIVALEEVGEEDEDLPGFEPIDEGEDGDLDDGMDGGFSGGLGVEPSGSAAVVAASAQETPFPGYIVGLLGAGMLSMLLCGVMAMDLLQSMWSWQETYSVKSGLLESLADILGL